MPLQVLEGTPTRIALTPSSSALFVGCQCGTLQHFDVATLNASRVAVQLHANDSTGISALAVLGEDSLVTADSHGIMHAMVLTDHLNHVRSTHTQSATPANDMTAQNSCICMPSSGLFDILDAAMKRGAGLQLACAAVMPLDEVLKVILSKV